MKISLSVKFILTYIFLGAVGFILLNTAGAYFIDQYMISTESSNLYSSVTSLSETTAIKSYQDESDLRDLHELLRAVSESDQANILILDTRGTLMLDTQTEFSPTDQPALSGFDPTSFSGSYYTVDTYFDHYSENQLNVTVPITLSMSTRGYISIHEPITEVLKDREVLLSLVFKFYLAALALFFLLIVVIFITVNIPLSRIIHGTKEFAAGNMEYTIPVHRHDEMGYLSDTLNYMADEMRQTDEFQRKFISNVSHDFRSPLTSIKGYVEAILDGTIPYEMQNKYLDIVLFETSRLTKLTQGMLQLNDMDAKAYMLKIVDFDLNPVIKNTAASFEGTCRSKRVGIKLLLSSAVEYVSADEEKIQQVMYNLIDNALKFSGKDSEITIETTRKNEKLLVSVKDQGSGIPQKDLSKIWNRFYKQDTSRGKDRTGTGLGLSIVKEIINTHRQTINVVSTEGVGTTFSFTLDRASGHDDEEPQNQ